MNLNTLTKSAIFGAILCVIQLTFSSLPFELITPLIVLFALRFELKQTLGIVLTFCMLNTFIWGFQLYTMYYFILFPLVAILSYLFTKRFKNYYAIYFFILLITIAQGFFWAIVYSAFLQIDVLFKYYLAGLPFDLIHGFSTFLVSLFIFEPLSNVLINLENRRFKK